MALLTNLGIHRAKPKDSVYTLKDGRGLSLRIEPNGAKLWHFRFYWQGKQQRISFGTFPDVDLKTARERREEARSCLANNKLTKQAEDEIRGITFATFVEYWKILKLKNGHTNRKRSPCPHFYGFGIWG